jgi:hypothetical protein
VNQLVRTLLLISLVTLFGFASPQRDQSPPSIIVVTIDGLRWQEFFGGAQSDYFKRDKDGSGGEPEQRFWRADATARREALMPFVWKTIAARGQIFGDKDAGSESRLTNGLWFSYPGYSEMFAGFADARVNSNDKVPNPNVTVLEWLNGRPGFAGKVGAFGSWDVLPSILNADRSKLPIGTGWSVHPSAPDLPRFWSYGPLDPPVVTAAVEYLRARKPRVLYVMLGEGDEWAHQGRYDLYLDATRRADLFIERLWTTAQSMPEYRGRTALLVTTDHGRGATVKDWTDHGKDVRAAERTWIALLGAGVPANGLRHDVNVTTSQIAATIAALVGDDYRAAQPKAAAPLPLSPR